MSLELALQQNTAAINTLIELLKGGAIPATAVEEPKATKPKATKVGNGSAPAAKDTSPATTGNADTAGAEKSEPVTASSSASVPGEALTYDETASYLVKVSAKLGKAGIAQVLNKFGAEKNLKEVDPSNWASVITACQELLA